MSDPKKERRKTRRVTAPSVGATLAGPGGESIEAESMNLSAGGVYLVSPRYLAPFAKVELNLVLPPFGQEPGPGGGEATKDKSPKSGSGAVSSKEATRKGPEGPDEGTGADDAGAAGAGTAIRAEGIVVRCEPHPKMTERYSLAIAFLHLTPAERNQIEAYVNWRLERSLIESAEVK